MYLLTPTFVGTQFGADIVEKFNRKHDFDLIVRAHQVWHFGPYER